MPDILCQTDSYIQEFNPMVVAIDEAKSAVACDRTAFYLGGGGQPHDRGWLLPKINLLPEGIAEVRTVEIVGLDVQADGGTHVANTHEVGYIRLVDYQSKGKINKRIYIAVEA